MSASLSPRRGSPRIVAPLRRRGATRSGCGSTRSSSGSTRSCRGSTRGCRGSTRGCRSSTRSSSGSTRSCRRSTRRWPRCATRRRRTAWRRGLVGAAFHAFFAGRRLEGLGNDCLRRGHRGLVGACGGLSRGGFWRGTRCNGLFAPRSAAEHFDFAAAEFAPLTHGESLEFQRTKRSPSQLLHGIAKTKHEVLELQVAVLAEFHVHDALGGIRRDQTHRTAQLLLRTARRGKDLAFDRCDGGGVERSIKRDVVALGHFVARMGEAIGELTIVGENQQSAGIKVEPTNAITYCTNRAG